MKEYKGSHFCFNSRISKQFSSYLPNAGQFCRHATMCFAFLFFCLSLGLLETFFDYEVCWRSLPRCYDSTSKPLHTQLQIVFLFVLFWKIFWLRSSFRATLTLCFRLHFDWVQWTHFFRLSVFCSILSFCN